MIMTSPLEMRPMRLKKRAKSTPGMSATNQPDHELASVNPVPDGMGDDILSFELFWDCIVRTLVSRRNGNLVVFIYSHTIPLFISLATWYHLIVIGMRCWILVLLYHCLFHWRHSIIATGIHGWILLVSQRSEPANTLLDWWVCAKKARHIFSFR